MALRYILTVIASVVFFARAHAQDGYLRLKTLQRMAYQNKASFAWSGAAIEGGANLRFKSNHTLQLGAEAGFMEWGGQTLLRTGYQFPFSVHPSVDVIAGAGLYNGVVLYRPAPLYSGGAEVQVGAMCPVAQRLSMAFTTSFRYSVTPQYRRYSSVYSYWHFSVDVAFIIHPKKKTNPLFK